MKRSEINESTVIYEYIKEKFAGQSVVILGLARQGQALARFFINAGAHVVVSDMATEGQLITELKAIADLPIEFALGGHPENLLDQCDLLCLSGGVPPQIKLVQEAINQGIPLSNDSLLTLQLTRDLKLGTVIAITGSSGKTTTTTLVGEILRKIGASSDYSVHVGGNIGTPLLDKLEAIHTNDYIVLELSSFQLELFNPKLAWGSLENLGPDVAAILNVTPNHLDRHQTMFAYTDAKLNLLRNLRPNSAIVLNADDPTTGHMIRSEILPNPSNIPPNEWQLDELLTDVQGMLTARKTSTVPFSRSIKLERGAWVENGTLMYNGQPMCKRSEVLLRGDHNISNLLAAATIVGTEVQVKGDNTEHMAVQAISHVARHFTGVPHRLEVVAETDGITWINDSIATAPERAVAGLRSFVNGEQTLTLLAGGKDKNLPWDTFADEVLSRVNFLIGFGSAGPMIVDKVQERARFTKSRAPNSAVVQRLDEAVALAQQIARSSADDTGSNQLDSLILLSPGGTSYDAYRDFEERGEHFRQLVRKLVG